MSNPSTPQLQNPLHLIELALIAKGHSSESARAMIKKSLGIVSLGDGFKVSALLNALVEGVHRQEEKKGGQPAAFAVNKLWGLLAEESRTTGR